MKFKHRTRAFIWSRDRVLTEASGQEPVLDLPVVREVEQVDLGASALALPHVVPHGAVCKEIRLGIQHTNPCILTFKHVPSSAASENPKLLDKMDDSIGSRTLRSCDRMCEGHVCETAVLCTRNAHKSLL